MRGHTARRRGLSRPTASDRGHGGPVDGRPVLRARVARALCQPRAVRDTAGRHATRVREDAHGAGPVLQQGTAVPDRPPRPVCGRRERGTAQRDRLLGAAVGNGQAAQRARRRQEEEDGLSGMRAPPADRCLARD